MEAACVCNLCADSARAALSGARYLTHICQIARGDIARACATPTLHTAAAFRATVLLCCCVTIMYTTVLVLLAMSAHALPQPLEGGCCACPGPGPEPGACGDSAPAPSHTHHTVLPHTRSATPKEDGKNLLEPEVTLAASMLDTLHEVTEEEYRDALARDVATLDAEPEESARSVLVVVAPHTSPRDEDEFLAGAGHAHESRCIHPPASSLGNMRSSANPLPVLPDTLTLPKLKHNEFPYNNLLHLDSSVGASDANEIVADADGIVRSALGRKPLLPNNVMKSFSGDRSTDFKFGQTNKQSMETERGNSSGDILSLKPKLGSRSNSVENFGTALKNMRLAGLNENKKPLIEYDKLPLNLRNILKLRDVELIPKSIRNKSPVKPKIDLSKFAIPTTFKKNTINMNNEREESPSNINAFRLSSDDELGEKEMETGASESVFDKTCTQDVADTYDERSMDSLIEVNDFLSDQPQEETFSNDSDINHKELDMNETEFSAIKKSEPENISVTDETFAIAACNDPSEYEEMTLNEVSVTDQNNNLLSKLEILEKPNSMRMPANFANTKSVQNHEQISNSQDSTPVSKNQPEARYTLPAIGDTLTQLRENVVKQLDNLDRPLFISKNAMSINDNSQGLVFNGEISSISEKNETDDLKADMASDASNVVDNHVTGNGISMNDLQNMSDTLLESNPNILSKVQSNSNLDENNSTLSEVESRFKDVNINSCKLESDKLLENINETEKSAADHSSGKEMETGSSVMMINTLPSILDSLNPNLKMRSPVLDSIAHQPASDPLNLLDVRDRLRDIFNTKEDSSEDYEDVSSLEIEATNDTPAIRMAASASTRNTHKELPLLRQLEEFNNNIINAKPIALAPSDSLLDKHRLGLNSFKAHLPSPTTLELKPLNIEPINKAKLSNPTSNFRTARPKSLKLKQSSSAPWDSLSSLDELRNSLRSNNMFDNLARPQLYTIKQNLHTHDIDDVAKNIRLNTEKTFKGIQRKMKSALKRPALQSPLSSSLATPQDLLDDMNDKLKGLQYDLNDRLASLRESFLDSTRTKSSIDQPRKASNGNVMKNIRKPKPKSDTTSRFQSSASTAVARVISNNEKSNPLRSHPVNQDRNTLAEVQTSASESPRPTTYSLHREKNDDRNIRRPLLKSATSSLLNQREPKVTISFGTTPPPAPAAPTSRTGAASGATRMSALPRAGPAANTWQPLRSSAPMPSSIDEDFEDTSNNFSYEEMPSEDVFAAPVFRQMSNAKAPLKHEDNTDRMRFANDLSDRKGLFLRKSLRNKPSQTLSKSLASPDGESLGNFRKWSENLESNTKSTQVIKPEQVDMLRSASEHNQLLGGESLKQNVSYKCRLTCTKEIK